MIPEKPTRGEIEAIRAAFPAGTAVELLALHDPYRTMQPGSLGVVNAVDDIGTLHVDWKDAGSFGVVPGVDDVRREDGVTLGEICFSLQG